VHPKAGCKTATVPTSDIEKSISEAGRPPPPCKRVMEPNRCSRAYHWNKGKIVCQKAQPEAERGMAVRIRPQLAKRVRDLALLRLGIQSTLRACDLLTLCGITALAIQSGAFLFPSSPGRSGFQGSFNYGAVTSGITRRLVQYRKPHRNCYSDSCKHEPARQWSKPQVPPHRLFCRCRHQELLLQER
jgi:hypothetical protein